jgi:MarR family transcriptional regulator for hemolysin
MIKEEKSLPLGMVVGQMRNEVFKVFKKWIVEKAEIKLTIDEYRLLHAIKREDNDVIQKNMAEAMGKDKSAILRLIDSLQKKELARRIVDASDRRKNYLTVTPKGEKVIEQYIVIELALIAELQQNLTKTDIETFYKVVNQIKNNAEKL